MLSLLLLGGCAGLVPPPPAPPPLADSAIRARLQAQFNDWRGVPYRIGGLSRRGIDCSGFVQLTYRQKFGRKLPRTTRQLAATGNPVEASQHRPGDLVFFQTGLFQRHVGIYLGRGRFLHASTSRGVPISRLDSPYCRRTYRHSRRVW